MKSKTVRAISLFMVFAATCIAIVPVAGAAEIPQFNDIENSFYKEYIEYCVEHGFIAGFGDGTFRPDASMTRGNVTRAWCNYYKYRLNHTFKDLPELKWEDNAAVILYALRLVEGYSDNTFSADDPMTREQIAFLVMKTCDLSEQDNGVLPEVDFKDTASISGWAKDAVSIVSQYRIMTGDANEYFHPKNPITRGQFCRVLWDLNEEEWKKAIPPEDVTPTDTIINAADLSELSDLTPAEADGTDVVSNTLTTTVDAHFTADVSWEDLTGDNKINPGETVGTVTLTAETGYTFTGTDIDEDALETVFTAETPAIAVTDNTGETLVFTLTY